MDILQTLAEGATYANHPFHYVLNYSVLLVMLVPNLFGFGNNTKAWLVLFILFTILQISLWFLTGAVGISLIWCALAGYNLLVFFTYRKQEHATALLLLLSPLVALAAIVFYAIYFPPLTTIAHGIALVLGIVLGWRLRLRRKKSF